MSPCGHRTRRHPRILRDGDDSDAEKIIQLAVNQKGVVRGNFLTPSEGHLRRRSHLSRTGGEKIDLRDVGSLDTPLPQIRNRRKTLSFQGAEHRPKSPEIRKGKVGAMLFNRRFHSLPPGVFPDQARQPLDHVFDAVGLLWYSERVPFACQYLRKRTQDKIDFLVVPESPSAPRFPPDVAQATGVSVH